ncbi:MAG TPA: ABC transporter permease [Actinomycetota bacterium]|nr:ABC transporter permease [Actinomycetota bacterium]
MSTEISGLDSLEARRVEPRRPVRAAWTATWPKLAAVAVVVGVWQSVAWLRIRPSYVLPDPATVLGALGELFSEPDFLQALGVTVQRGAAGFGVAIVIGTLLGIAVSRSSILRRTFGSLITGLQSMPSIAWFPFAILIFKLSEGAIMFVVVLGAAPAIANGLITGVDHIPPLLLRAGRVLGARGLSAYRHVILPAAFPEYLAGMKQGWAFAWRSLMAGELLVIIESRPSIGAKLQFARDLSDAPGLLALMIIVLLIGMVVDGLFFGTLERSLRNRRGLNDAR